MTKSEVLAYIRDRNGAVFTVRFRKRSTGEEREMTCRQGVTAGLADFPTKPATDWKATGLIPVWSELDNGYRSIPVEGLLAVLIDGQWQEVVG